ncbi:Fic family protein [Agromyces laixinhei]|uniref:Fic family protein n=1 Tax=Agromyces laixinhei TaxID=2585717 RepID=UPI00111787E5|nr:Fic family protein [Agromyces laixinhei]
MPTDSSGSDSRTSVLSWPALDYELHRWAPRAPQIHSNAAVRRQTGHYRAAVTPEIADLDVRLSAESARDLEEAAAALVAFDSHAQKTLGINNPALGPMSAILLRTESASSSQIEQLTTSAKQLALAELDEGNGGAHGSGKANARTVIGNVRAMEAALALADHVNAETILAMHSALLRHQYGFEDEAGRFRHEQVWIGGEGAGPIGAEFVAPHHDRVRRAVDDLVVFIDREDIPVLAQVAISHAQFETIHPFVDGNGRTGRAVAQSVIHHKRLVTSTTVPISAGLLVDTERYFGALDAYRDGDAGPIVRAFADASRLAAFTGTALVNELAEQLEIAREQLGGVRTDAAAWKLLPTLIGQPVVNTRYLQQRLAMSEASSLRALDTLVERGVLIERTGYGRNRVWQHSGIIAVLDAYAAGIRRRAQRRA